MNETIKRLKKNLCVRCRLPKEDREVLDSVPDKYILTLDDYGAWVLPDDRTLAYRRYRISEDYNGEPDTPVFPGYVLWPVDHGCYKKTHANGSVSRISLHEAINNSCEGYVFREWPHRCFNTSIMFVNLDGQLEYECVGDCKPAHLGWVRLKEQGGGGE